MFAAAAAAAAAAPVPPGEEVCEGEGMRGAHMLVWLGDFNYRIDGGYEAVKERAIRNELAPLLQMVGAAGIGAQAAPGLRRQPGLQQRQCLHVCARVRVCVHVQASLGWENMACACAC